MLQCILSPVLDSAKNGKQIMPAPLASRASSTTLPPLQLCEDLHSCHSKFPPRAAASFGLLIGDPSQHGRCSSMR